MKEDLAWNLIGCGIIAIGLIGLAYSVTLALQLYGG
jgi:hypothetical protein